MNEDYVAVAIIPRAKYDLSYIMWLKTNVSEQNQLWKIEIDLFERYVVYFKNKENCAAFKSKFGL